MRFGSLFAGIGGIDLGLERAGMECAWQVEIDDYCQRVLTKHWPDVERFEDVRECGRGNLAAVDLIVGGFPCQPHSIAGKRRGAADDRNLWPEFSRIVAELKPRYVLAENVPGIITTYLDTVLSDLERLDYTCATFDIPAVAFDAPHRRHRIFIVAYRTGTGLEGATRKSLQGREHGLAGSSIVAHPSGKHGNGRNHNGRSRRGQVPQSGDSSKEARFFNSWWSVEPNVGRVAHGIPSRVDRLRGLGNAIVPQVAEWIGLRIMEWEHRDR